MTPVALLSSWLAAAMLVWSPPSSHAYTGASEEVTVTRYVGIAEDMAEVATEELPLFTGRTGYAKTALVALSVVSFESGGFRADLDNDKPTGDCHDGHCRAVCLAQIWLRPGDHLASRRDCFRLEIARLRESFAACRALPLLQRLGVYATGTCLSAKGQSLSENRMRRALSYWASSEFLPPVEDGT